MNPWIPIVVTIVLNVGSLVYALGKIAQTVNTNRDRLVAFDKILEQSELKSERWQEKVEKQSLLHSMLPECVSEFGAINRQLGILIGKVDTLIGINDK